MGKKILLLLLTITIIDFVPIESIGTSKPDEFQSFLNNLKKAVKSQNPQSILQLVKFPLSVGMGGDAYYNYFSADEDTFINEYYRMFINNYKKKLGKLKPEEFQKIIKNGPNLVSFTYGSNENGESDGIDHASAIPDGTLVYFWETCEGDAGPCIGFFISKFGQSYKLWGITYGR